MAELCDSAESKEEHRLMLLAARMHHSTLTSQRVTRSTMGDFKDLLREIIDIQLKNQEMLETLSLKQKASELVDTDSTIAQIPWSCHQDILDAMDNVDRIESIKRLMFSPAVASTMTHYMKGFMKCFFTPDYRGRVYLGTPIG